MKKIICAFFALLMLFLSGCALGESGIEMEQTNGYARITLDQFEGEKKIKIENTAGEGSLYYITYITSGAVTVDYTEGWPWPEARLCRADAAHNTNGGTYLVGGKYVYIIVSAKEKTSGEILLVCSQSTSPFE